MTSFTLTHRRLIDFSAEENAHLLEQTVTYEYFDSLKSSTEDS